MNSNERIELMLSIIDAHCKIIALTVARERMAGAPYSESLNEILESEMRRFDMLMEEVKGA